MANQTVDFGLICKVKRFVFPTVACVTRCATSLVANGANSEIVQRGCGFTMLNLLSVLHGVG